MRTLRESLLDDFGSQTKDLKQKAIKDWLEKNNKYKTDGLEFNPDGTIDIDGFYYIGKGNFPDYIDFNNCKGNFDIANSRMTSLRGCPKEVGDRFDCSNNQLKTLNGSPKKVGSDFDCHSNKLTSLEGCPDIIDDNFICSHNKLKSFKDGPRYIKNILYVKQNDLDPNELQWIRENVKYYRLFA